MFESIERESLSYRIIDAIKGHILQNKLKPGDRLATEREMAEAFGVSRPSVREAIKVLAAIGVLESRPKRGISIKAFDPHSLFKYLSFVQHVDKETVTQMVELRRVIELGIAELVTERATEEDLEAIRRHVETMRTNLKNPVVFFTHDFGLHFALYKATGSPSVQALGRVLMEFFVTAHRQWWDVYEDIDPEHFKNHERIFLALEARDADGVRQAIRDHFKTSRVLQIETYKADSKKEECTD